MEVSLWMSIEYRRVAECHCANFIENCYMSGSEHFQCLCVYFVESSRVIVPSGLSLRV